MAVNRCNGTDPLLAIGCVRVVGSWVWRCEIRSADGGHSERTVYAGDLRSSGVVSS